jgi:predicted AlkP superfamily pyrophosphatase or phosphodiesterase
MEEISRRSFLATGAALTGAGTRGRRLAVFSIDGLDHRYLRDRDRLGLRIPTLRRLLREGLWAAEGVVGEVPTVTWPSHTTMLTGVPPRVHGILGNRRPAAEGGQYYWELSLCRVPTLWHAAREAGLRTAAVTWPVTVTPIIDLNLPEFFRRRRGGAMDLRSIEEKATARLVERIAAAFPSFPQEWTDDRTRCLAALWMLREGRPDLLCVHFVDLDAESHDNAPFTREACAVLEYTDELLGRLLDALPADTVVAIVSDHGFEAVQAVVHPWVLLGPQLAEEVEVRHGVAAARSGRARDRLLELAADPRHGIGREVSREEVRRFAPELAEMAAVFEPASGFFFGQARDGAAQTAPPERGMHGFWPGRPDYRATFLLWGPGVAPGQLPEISLGDMAPRFAGIVGLRWNPGPDGSPQSARTLPR